MGKKENIVELAKGLLENKQRTTEAECNVT